MSIFSKIGKAIKKVVKVAVPLVKFGSAFIPGVGGVVSKLLTSGVGAKATSLVKRIEAGQQVLRSSGSPFAAPLTPQLVPPSVSAHVVAVKHARTTHKVASLLKRRAPAKRKRATAKRTTTKRRKTRLKFGSPAWRKKFIKKRR